MLLAPKPVEYLTARVATLSLCVLVAFACSIMSARAAVISNKDGTSYKITIDEGGKRNTHEIATGALLDSVCLKGCIVTLDGVSDGAYKLPEGNEIVTIEEGVLFYDGAVAAKPEEE